MKHIFTTRREVYVIPETKRVALRIELDELFVEMDRGNVDEENTYDLSRLVEKNPRLVELFNTLL